jgi:hypothetical protein
VSPELLGHCTPALIQTSPDQGFVAMRTAGSPWSFIRGREALRDVDGCSFRATWDLLRSCFNPDETLAPGSAVSDRSILRGRHAVPAKTETPSSEGGKKRNSPPHFRPTNCLCWRSGIEYVRRDHAHLL